MKDANVESDVCLIVEGAYPYVVGGVASWVQDLIIGMPDIRFSIIAIKPSDRAFPWKVDPPPNVVSILEVPLTFQPARPRRLPSRWITRIGKLLLSFFEHGQTRCLMRLIKELSSLKARPSVGDILSNPQMFELLQRHYHQGFRSTSFHHYFWAMRALLGGLLAVLLTPFPKARVYHTISTGFAGLLAARIAYQSGHPAFVTEHGLYLLERQIEVMMADWIGDQIDSGLVLDRDDHDMRDLWINAFRSYTQACYNACDPIIALYTANNVAQQRLGAPPGRLRVIPNGIDPSRFGTLNDQRDPEHPLVALIGRVVPIKDIKTFIRAAGLVQIKVPNARFVVLGPEDEDKDYVFDCRALVKDLELGDVFSFAGRVDVGDWLPRIDLLVLTSLSEAQPLVILEAGVCGIPVVAPDVGSCREMIEGSGRSLEKPGGIVTALVDPDDTARAITRLLKDRELRTEMGAALRDRVIRSYDRSSIIAQYKELYETLGERDMQTARTRRPLEMAGVI